MGSRWSSGDSSLRRKDEFNSALLKNFDSFRPEIFRSSLTIADITMNIQVKFSEPINTYSTKRTIRQLSLLSVGNMLGNQVAWSRTVYLNTYSVKHDVFWALKPNSFLIFGAFLGQDAYPLSYGLWVAETIPILLQGRHQWLHHLHHRRGLQLSKRIFGLHRQTRYYSSNRQMLYHTSSGIGHVHGRCARWPCWNWQDWWAL